MGKSVLELYVEEVVRASPEYMKKENVRQAIQDVLMSLVAKGEIASPADLESFFSSATMSLRALQAVPFKVYQQLGKR